MYSLVRLLVRSPMRFLLRSLWVSPFFFGAFSSVFPIRYLHHVSLCIPSCLFFSVRYFLHSSLVHYTVRPLGDGVGVYIACCIRGPLCVIFDLSHAFSRVLHRLFLVLSLARFLLRSPMRFQVFYALRFLCVSTCLSPCLPLALPRAFASVLFPGFPYASRYISFFIPGTPGASWVIEYQRKKPYYASALDEAPLPPPPPRCANG